MTISEQGKQKMYIHISSDKVEDIVVIENELKLYIGKGLLVGVEILDPSFVVNLQVSRDDSSYVLVKFVDIEDTQVSVVETLCQYPIQIYRDIDDKVIQIVQILCENQTIDR